MIVSNFSNANACSPPTFFYKGRCYDICPIRTYAFKHDGNIDGHNDDETNPSTNLQENEELQSIERKKRNKNLYRITEDFSEYDPSKAELESIKTISCEPCDKSCLQCYGPLNSQCIICPFGTQLKRMPHTKETYCINLSERSSGNAFGNISPHDFKTNLMILLILVLFIIAMTLILFVVKLRKTKLCVSCSREQIDNEINSTYSYDRLALIADEDNQEEENDFLSPLPPTIKIYTDDKKDDRIIDR